MIMIIVTLINNKYWISFLTIGDEWKSFIPLFMF